MFLGDITLPRPETRTYSERTAWAIDEAVRGLVETAFARATAILERNRAMLDQTARKLLELETLTAADLPVPVGEAAAQQNAAPTAASEAASVESSS